MVDKFNSSKRQNLWKTSTKSIAFFFIWVEWEKPVGSFHQFYVWMPPYVWVFFLEVRKIFI